MATGTAAKSDEMFLPSYVAYPVSVFYPDVPLEWIGERIRLSEVVVEE